ncbi:response regulator transcription factor [Dokdonella soli]|uniref:Response regulator transcription factor n=1 Tax=Dokdonella soli TaxID=529810 RepID=A0ABP3TN19_9GAMM
MLQSNDDAPQLALHPALVVEDDPRTQERLARILTALDIARDGIHFAGDLAQARDCFDTQRFALALVDIVLPDGSGIDFIQWLRGRDADATAVVVSTFATQDLILAALHAGAAGYLLKERDDSELIAALRSIQRGGAPIDPFVAKYILRHLGMAPVPVATPSGEAGAGPAGRLTRREEEILNLVALGLISREIAEKLSRSTLTVEGHIKSIFRKLRVSTRTQAIHQARSLGLLR